MLFKAIKDGISGEIGRNLLECPVEEVNIGLKAEKENFNIQGSIGLVRDSVIHNPRFEGNALGQVLAKKYNPDGKIVTRGQSIIITAPRGTKIVIERGDLKFVVGTGLIWEDSSRSMQLIPAPPSTRESFNTVMADFIDVFKATVEEIYKSDEKVSPDEELILRPPKVGLKGRGRGGEDLFGEIKTPQGLLDKVIMGKPDIKFEDIGGQEGAKREIQGLAFALKNPELYKKWGTKPPKGIILHGPPGTGKTLLAKALASQADAQFLHVQATDIVSKWYGDSEKIVRGIFDLANSSEGKTIIFFDEIDAIAPKREGSHEATKRTVSALLESMDGLAAKGNVIVVASTNRLDFVDPALLRAGRFDRWVEAPLPDEAGRKQIFNIHIKKAEEVAGRKLFLDINIDKLVKKTNSFNGADIAEIIRRALEEKVRLEGTVGFEPNLVDTDNIISELDFYEKTRGQERNR